MNEWMLEFVNDFGYLGIFLLIFIESVFPPIPSEAVLLFGGAMTVSTNMNIPATILSATAGSLIGAVVLYCFGRAFQTKRLKKILAGKVGRTLQLKPEHVDKAEGWFLKYEGKAVLICRCVPIVRSLISIPAGFAEMNILRFLILTVFGSLIWNTVLVLLGAGLGTAWETAMPFLDKYTYAVCAAIAVVLIALVVFFIIKKRKK